METVAELLEQLRRCRRLARATVDSRTVDGLTALAEEYEAKVKAAEASRPAIAGPDHAGWSKPKP